MKLKILIILLTLFTLLNKVKSQCLQLDIVLVADFSGSVDGYEPFVKKAFREFTERFELSEGGVKIGIVAFSEYAYIIAELTTDVELLDNAIIHMDGLFKHANTNLYEGLEVAHKLIIERGRSSVPKMIIVISDGDYNGPDSLNTLSKVHQIKMDDIMICGVLITTQYKKPKVMRMISNDFCYMESSYQALADVLKSMEICL